MSSMARLDEGTDDNDNDSDNNDDNDNDMSWLCCLLSSAARFSQN